MAPSTRRRWSQPVQTYLPTQHKNGIWALSLRRQLGVSYNTAWRLKHKLMQAMVERGRAQMDDAYWGGERHGGRRGRGAEGVPEALNVAPDDVGVQRELRPADHQVGRLEPVAE